MEIERSIDNVVGATATDDDDTSISCPLFMDGLPRDFSTNPALAAIASLMNDASTTVVDDDAPSTITTKKTPTESVAAKRNEKTKYKPYTKSNRKTKEKSGTNEPVTTTSNACSDRSSCNDDNAGTTTTIGEASLFLKMWKL